MDIKAQIESIITKVTGDEQVKEKFNNDPVGTVRGFVGDAADNETVKKIVEAVKAALASGKLGALGEKVADMLGFKKDEENAEAASEDKPEESSGGVLGGLGGMLGGLGGSLGGLFGGKKDAPAEENKDE